MRNAFMFHIQTPEGLSFTWIGGGLKRSKRPTHVWLTKPTGEPLLELPQAYVRPIDRAEAAALYFGTQPKPERN